MPAILPVFCIGLIAWCRILAGDGIRRALLIGAVTAGVVVTISTELLSLFHLLIFKAIAAVWIACCVVTVALVFRSLIQARHRLSQDIAPARNFASRLFNPTALAISIVAVVCGLTGLVSAPNNYDSMIYHLTRVMHWMSQGSVAHYPCNLLAQLYHPPFAEFAILHLQILSSEDRFAAAVAWGAMIGCICGVTLIIAKVGGSIHAELFAAVFVATIPSGILQSASTQNNYVLAFWLVCFFYFTLELRLNCKEQWLLPALLAGASLGLAVLTKGTAYSLGFPFVVCLLVCVSLRGMTHGVKTVAVVGLIAVGLNMGHWTRNLQWFHSPFFPSEENDTYRITSPSVGLWLTNLIWNCTAHLWVPTHGMAIGTQRAIGGLQSWTHVGSADARLIMPRHPFHVVPSSIQEDVAGNPIHFILILVVLLGVLVATFRRMFHSSAKWKDPGIQWARLLLLLIVVGLSTFCATIRWIEFNVRLHLPLFVISAIPVGIVLSQQRWRRAIPWLSAVLLGMAIPCLTKNPNHPFFGRHSVFHYPREQQYFLTNPKLLKSYEQATDLLASQEVAKDGHIGIEISNQWEYPLWVMLHKRTGCWPSIEAVPGDRVPAAIPRPNVCEMTAVVVSDSNLADQVCLQCKKFDRRWQFERLTVLTRGRKVASQN